MKKKLGKGWALALLVVSGSLALPESSLAAQQAQAPSAPTRERSQFTAGEEIARTVTLTTGVPISPLLGVSALGAWRWWRTPAAARAELPWYARPWFWGSGLFLVFLFAANTTIGAAVPGLKKPMDFVEEHENKLSALVASPIVLLEVKRLLGLGFPALARAAATAAGLAARRFAAWPSRPRRAARRCGRILRRPRSGNPLPGLLLRRLHRLPRHPGDDRAVAVGAARHAAARLSPVAARVCWGCRRGSIPISGRRSASRSCSSPGSSPAGRSA